MKKLLMLISLYLFLAGVFSTSAQTTSSDAGSQKEVKKWFKKKEWLNGLALKPHKSINEVEFARQYRINKTYWDMAFAFLKNHDLASIAKGRYPIDGENVYASVTYDSTKDFNKTNWESHRKYNDIQYIIEGEEKIGVAPIAAAKVTNEYNEKRESANYSAEGKIYSAKPGTFFIFFPSDVHRPGITPGGNKPVKKIVVKVKTA
ncbi:MAG: YhcH/YjgK/YiaL family protein [Bacteroidota bacterium]|nr:YhcH/YjgK/YiaL family protein [Bacteroidota bacterium]